MSTEENIVNEVEATDGTTVEQIKKEQLEDGVDTKAAEAETNGVVDDAPKENGTDDAENGGEAEEKGNHEGTEKEEAAVNDKNAADEDENQKENAADDAGEDAAGENDGAAEADDAGEEEKEAPATEDAAAEEESAAPEDGAPAPEDKEPEESAPADDEAPAEEKEAPAEEEEAPKAAEAEAPEADAKEEAPKDDAKEEAPKDDAKEEAPEDDAKEEEAPEDDAKEEEAPADDAKEEEAPVEVEKAPEVEAPAEEDAAPEETSAAAEEEEAPAEEEPAPEPEKEPSPEPEEPAPEPEEEAAPEPEKEENNTAPVEPIVNGGETNHVPEFVGGALKHSRSYTTSGATKMDSVATESGVEIPDFAAMSTQAQLQDDDSLKQAIAAIRDDTAADIGRKSWVLVGHVDNHPNQIHVIGQDISADSFDEFRNKLEDGQVMYGLLRLTTTVDMSNTVKFIYVHWVGDNVPFAKKGRFGVVHGSVEENFMPFHVQIETANKEELADEELTKLVEESSFTRNKVIEGNNLEGRQMRGFTAHQVKGQNKGACRSVAPPGAAVQASPELSEVINAVRSDKSNTKWVLAAYEDANLKKPLIVHAQGEGDIEELKESLVDDQVMYALFRTSDVIDEIPTVKFVYIYWVGPDVKPLTKGRVSAYAGPVEQLFSPTHVCLSFNNRYDLEDSIIKDKVMASSGSKSFVM